MTIEELTIQDLRAENAQLRKQIDRMQDTIENLRWQIENTEDDGK
jgi:predicted RNase H-like nuclease (RuvC/YqgF family)